MISKEKLPKISVITPSFNQGKYIEETIQTIADQRYPNLEYIIIDGGSTDQTIEIIKKHEKHVSYWESEKDRGQSHAINKGFERASGDILCWLNSDDMYMPGALHHIAQQVMEKGDGIYFGNCIHFKNNGTGVMSFGSDVKWMRQRNRLDNIDFIIQPSTFWTKTVWEKVGRLKEDLHYAFDWEWFLRAEKMGIPFYSLSKALSMYRMHEEHKTGTGGSKRQQEILAVYKMYSEKYAHLYELALTEDVTISKLQMRAARKLLTTLRRPSTNADIIKFLKPKQYKNYSVLEIANAIAML